MEYDSNRRWLFLAVLLTMPVPYFLAAVEWAPVLRLGFVTGLFSAVWLAEPGGRLTFFVVLGIVQLLAYFGLFWLGTGVLARALDWIGSPPLRIAALGTFIFLLVTSSLLPIYETPLSSLHARSSLWQLFH